MRLTLDLIRRKLLQFQVDWLRLRLVQAPHSWFFLSRLVVPVRNIKAIKSSVSQSLYSGSKFAQGSPARMEDVARRSIMVAMLMYVASGVVVRGSRSPIAHLCKRTPHPAS